MAINRAPFNALVDDAGTGLTGSIWNKAAIQGVLLDPIDVELAKPGQWVAAAPHTYVPVGGTFTQTAMTSRYTVIGKLLIWSFDLTGTFSTGVTYLKISTPTNAVGTGGYSINALNYVTGGKMVYVHILIGSAYADVYADLTASGTFLTGTGRLAGIVLMETT